MGTARRTLVWLSLLAAAGCATATGTAGSGDADAGSDAGPGIADGGVVVPDGGASPRRRVVILMIGDGMGREQLKAASWYASGDPESLYLQGMPRRGAVRTASLSGITDSAAAATTMATGARTFNGRIGLDRDGQRVETLVEHAQRLGMAAGVVTTASLPHATPGAFSAHRMSRHDYVDIAGDQVTDVKPDVLLGGGLRYYLPAGPDSERDDDGLLDELGTSGYDVVYDAAQLAAVDPTAGNKLFGSFANHHMTYVVDRGADSTEPTLAEMSMAAIRKLDRNEQGFFLLIEGGRIDHAGHANDLARNIGETLAFDDAVAAVHAWAGTSSAEVTLVVTADHECGGLTVEGPPAAVGELPVVSWRWGNHTNARVGVFADGPGTEVLDGGVVDFVKLHGLLAARLDAAPVVEPPRELVPDGSFVDLRYQVATQTAISGFGSGFNQLDKLFVDADARGLALGIEGVFEWESNAVVVLIDVDYGAATGLSALAPMVGDTDGRVDAILSAVNADGASHAGFGADYALVVWGGADPHVEDLIDDAGLRDLAQPDDLAWLGVAINFGEGVRTRQTPIAAVPGEGLETIIAWQILYPAGVPAGATLAVAVILVNDDGGYSSNQALPPFVAGTPNPARQSFSLPGLAVVPVDADNDGVVDAELSPRVD